MTELYILFHTDIPGCILIPLKESPGNFAFRVLLSSAFSRLVVIYISFFPVVKTKFQNDTALLGVLFTVLVSCCTSMGCGNPCTQVQVVRSKGGPNTFEWKAGVCGVHCGCRSPYREVYPNSSREHCQCPSLGL